MLKGQSRGYFDRLVPSHWLCPGMPPLTAFGPLAAPVGPLRCSRPPLALARVTHMHSAAHPRHSGAPGGLQRASRPCLCCHCRPFVAAHNCENGRFQKNGAQIIQGARFHPGPPLGVQRPKGGHPVQPPRVAFRIAPQRRAQFPSRPQFSAESSLCVLQGTSIPSSLAGPTRDVFRYPVSQEQCPENVVGTFLS